MSEIVTGARRCLRCDALIDVNDVRVKEDFKFRLVKLQKYCDSHGHVFDVREMWEAYHAPKIPREVV